MKYADLNAIDDIAIDFPDLKMVICHMGYPQYEMASFLIQKHPNVYGGVDWLAGVSALDRRFIFRYHPQVDYAVMSQTSCKSRYGVRYLQKK